MKSARRFEVDLLKAIGIVTVVLIHCLRPYWSPHVTQVELWISSATLFAVPGFLAASGFLNSTRQPVPSGVTRARLFRLLVPYLIASVAAQLYGALVDGKSLDARTILGDLLLASSFGPFYYVFVAVLFVLVTPVLARLPSRALVGVTGAALVGQWLSFTTVVALFWMVRNPFHWLGFFLAGWWLRRGEATALPWLARRRWSVCVLCAAGATAAAVFEFQATQHWLSGSLAWFKVACVLLLIVTLAAGRESRSRLVRFLSDSTYTIYLFHLFFVYWVMRLVPPPPGVFDPIALAAPWLAGVLGPLLLAAAGRAVLGARSRAILGS